MQQTKIGLGLLALLVLGSLLALLLTRSGDGPLAMGDGAGRPGAVPVEKTLAASCAACHGADGRTVGMEVPSLAGMPEVELAERLRALAAGDQAGRLMHQLVKGYTDEELEAIARVFAAAEEGAEDGAAATRSEAEGGQ